MISIHTSLAGSDPVEKVFKRWTEISIHTSLAGSDLTMADYLQSKEISIHTSLAGSDLRQSRKYQIFVYFNPHFPCGK